MWQAFPRLVTDLDNRERVYRVSAYKTLVESGLIRGRGSGQR